MQRQILESSPMAGFLDEFDFAAIQVGQSWQLSFDDFETYPGLYDVMQAKAALVGKVLLFVNHEAATVIEVACVAHKPPKRSAGQRKPLTTSEAADHVLQRSQLIDCLRRYCDVNGYTIPSSYKVDDEDRKARRVSLAYLQRRWANTSAFRHCGNARAVRAACDAMVKDGLLHPDVDSASTGFIIPPHVTEDQ